MVKLPFSYFSVGDPFCSREAASVDCLLKTSPGNAIDVRTLSRKHSLCACHVSMLRLAPLCL